MGNKRKMCDDTSNEVLNAAVGSNETKVTLCYGPYMN